MLKRIPLAQITRNPDQPRQHFDPRALAELADSISINGLKQPITVRPMEPDADGHRFMVVMGERRFRAHMILAERGEIDEILCHVRKMDDETMLIDAILENLQRAEVSPMEEAIAYDRAVNEHGITVDELARRLGIHQPRRIQERIDLLGLTADNRELLRQGIVTPTQAWHMARLSPNGQTAFIALVKQGLVSTNGAAEAAAAQIKSREDQCGMDLGEPPAPKRRVSVKSIEDKIAALSDAATPFFKDGQVELPEGDLDQVGAQRCIEKIRLLKAHLGQVERELMKRVSVSAVG